MPSFLRLPSTPFPIRRLPPSPEQVARARALVEGTALSQGAIVRATGLGLRPLRRLITREGWRRPPGAPRGRAGLPPETLDRMRELYEGTSLTQRAIARELQVSSNHVSHCIRRHRWVRQLPQGRAPVATRWPKRPGRPFRIDVVVKVRELYVGTILPLKAISARTGVSFPYVGKLGRRYGWTRPEGAPHCTRQLDPGRASPARRIAEGRRRVRALAESWAVSWAPEQEAAGALARAKSLAARAEARAA